MTKDEEDRRRKIAENIQKALGGKAVVIVPESQPAGAKVLAFKPRPKPEETGNE
mgnify:CR=1 FL=1